MQLDGWHCSMPYWITLLEGTRRMVVHQADHRFGRCEAWVWHSQFTCIKQYTEPMLGDHRYDQHNQQTQHLDTRLFPRPLPRVVYWNSLNSGRRGGGKQLEWTHHWSSREVCCDHSTANAARSRTLWLGVAEPGTPLMLASHDDVIKWKHLPHFWPFVRGIHRWISLTKARNAELWCFLWSAPE